MKEVTKNITSEKSRGLICRNCKYYEIDSRNLSQGTCHFNPPAVAPLIGRTPTGPTQQGWQSAFPPVQGEAWCAQCVPKLKMEQ